MEEFIKSLFGHVAVAGAAASAFATLTGILTGFYTERLTKARLHKTKDIIEEATEHLPRAISYRVRLNPATGEREIFDATDQPSERLRTTDATDVLPSANELAKNQVRSRLEDVIAERERQQRSAKSANITSNTLTFGQYIVGAVLTTSLAQNAFPKAFIGCLGLIVIICSAAKQHFRPDEKAQVSDQLARRLRALVRYTQDQIVILEAKSTNGEDRTDAFIQLLNEITASLNQIEAPDISSLPLKPIILEAPKPQPPTS